MLIETIVKPISRLPVSEEGFYLEIETQADMYREPGAVPISMLLAYGYLPKTALLDVETARRTFHEVNRRNGADRWMSWQMGQGALTAARLGETELAVAVEAEKRAAAQDWGANRDAVMFEFQRARFDAETKVARLRREAGSPQ